MVKMKRSERSCPCMKSYKKRQVIRSVKPGGKTGESFKVQLECFPLPTHRSTSGTPSGTTGVAGGSLWWHAVDRSIAGTAERSRGTGDEKTNTFTTNSTNAFGTCKALGQGPRSFAMRTINLDLLVSEGRRGGVRKAMVLALL